MANIDSENIRFKFSHKKNCHEYRIKQTTDHKSGRFIAKKNISFNFKLRRNTDSYFNLEIFGLL